jgi:chemotaxis protein CheY-P-specific phosphatase CheC
MTGSPTINPDTVVVQAEDIVYSDFDGEKVLLSVSAGKYFEMNETASRIWDLLAEPMTVSEICDILVGEYSIITEECLRAVAHSVSEMANQGIVRIRGTHP